MLSRTAGSTKSVVGVEVEVVEGACTYHATPHLGSRQGMACAVARIFLTKAERRGVVTTLLTHRARCAPVSLHTIDEEPIIRREHGHHECEYTDAWHPANDPHTAGAAVYKEAAGGQPQPQPGRAHFVPQLFLEKVRRRRAVIVCPWHVTDCCSACSHCLAAPRARPRARRRSWRRCTPARRRGRQ
jgi:hypothetical protein